MKITIFGANGPTGRHLTRQALDEGHEVTAFTRHPDGFPVRHDALQVAGGDMHDAAAVEAAVKGRDAVLCTVGVPFGKEPITVYSAGATNVIAAMEAHDITRLVCVTSSTMAEHHETGGGLVFRKLIQPYVVNVLGRTLYDDMRRMEGLLRASPLDWTIVRPSGLFEGRGVSDYAVGEDAVPGRFTSRQDLADCLLRQLSDARFVRRAIGVITTSGTPNMLAMVWREGVRKRD